MPGIPYIGIGHFNPRSLTGATIYTESEVCNMLISIHAPSRERLKAAVLAVFFISFQSTLPHGSDFSRVYCNSVYSNFNPRSLTGATFDSCAYVARYVTFQSTLPHGSDAKSSSKRLSKSQFQSTLPHGSDPYDRVIIVDNDISIHAPSRERPIRVPIFMRFLNFNPRSLAGATLHN